MCGLIVAVVSFAFFELAGVVYYLLAGLLAGNVWEAWRRVHRRSGSTFPERHRHFPARNRSVERPVKGKKSAAVMNTAAR